MKKMSIEQYANTMVKMANTYNIKISKTKVENLIREECPNGTIGEIFVYKFLQALKNKAEKAGEKMEQEDYESFKEILIKVGNSLNLEDEKENTNYNSETIAREKLANKKYHPQNKMYQTIIDEGRKAESRKDKKKPHSKLGKKIKIALGGLILGGAVLGGAASAFSTKDNINIKTTNQEQDINYNNQDGLNVEKENIENLNYIDYSYNQAQQEETEEISEKNELFNMIVEEYNEKYKDTPITIDDLGIIYTTSSNRIYYENGKYILNYDWDKASHPNAELISAEIPTYIVLNNKTNSPVSAIAQFSTQDGLKAKNIEVEKYILNYSNTGTYINDGKTVDLLIDNPKNLEEIDAYNEDIYELYEKQCIERQNDLKEKENQEKLEKLEEQGIQIVADDDGR